MKFFCAFILSLCLVPASRNRCHAQEIHDLKKDRSVLNGYFAALTNKSVPYFYGTYVDNHFSQVYTRDSLVIKRFLSAPNQWSDHRSILIAEIPDLDRLNNLEDTVFVYGPSSMAPFVRAYAPPPQPRAVIYKNLTLLKWLGNTVVNSLGFSPSRVAYGRWSAPYSVKSVESNPNALPYYMTHTNTNKYLLSVDK